MAEKNKRVGKIPPLQTLPFLMQSLCNGSLRLCLRNENNPSTENYGTLSDFSISGFPYPSREGLQLIFYRTEMYLPLISFLESLTSIGCWKLYTMKIR